MHPHDIGVENAFKVTKNYRAKHKKPSFFINFNQEICKRVRNVDVIIGKWI